MTAKEYLNQAKTLDQRINVKLDRVSRLRAMTQKITASLDGEQVSHTRNVTSLEDAIVRLMEEEESLNAAIDRLVDLKREVNGVLKTPIVSCCWSCAICAIGAGRRSRRSCTCTSARFTRCMGGRCER